ncbi:hypothetical protein SORDD17_00448 [Streptococcus oralis]|uniref:Uncharacterized protein n=1 Tax=Streptococcus oralis TaxID=1303 RepID=A0A139RNU4_STROR|nr:hypothetical protein SORDD17_00448 [Streptococcus oralis]
MNFKKNTLILINRKVLATQLQGFFVFGDENEEISKNS